MLLAAEGITCEESVKYVFNYDVKNLSAVAALDAENKSR